MYICIYVNTVYTICDPPTVSSIHKTRMSPTQGLGFSGVGSSGIRGMNIEIIVNPSDKGVIPSQQE